MSTSSKRWSSKAERVERWVVIVMWAAAALALPGALHLHDWSHGAIDAVLVAATAYRWVQLEKRLYVRAPTTTFTSATAQFTTADLGSAMTGVGVPPGTQIVEVVNPSTVVLSKAYYNAVPMWKRYALRTVSVYVLALVALAASL